MIKKNYKDTLSMPLTDFPMKGNLSQKETEIEDYWKKIDLYSKVLNKNQNNNNFCLHDGPPYANGNIHIGHALNKILKDFIIRFKTMQGFYAPYIPGWDCHGLPIETTVLKKNSKNKLTSKKIFLEKCAETALNYVKKQKEMFQRLGILGQWEKPYLTLDNSFIAEEIKIFSKMIEQKLIFKKLKPVYWSPFLQSVLAESEIEYKNKQSLSIYILFPILRKDIFKDAYFLVWTTTPWTLPANVAICVHPEKDYHIIKIQNKKYVLGVSVLEKLKDKFNWNEVEIIKTFKGAFLKDFIYENKIFNNKGKVVLDTFVSDTEGTGLVHIAPGHGLDDFLLSEKYNLNILLSINKKGLMSENTKQYKDLFYDEFNYQIVEDLKEKKLIILSETITHSYPHDERLKKPVVFLAIPQWFLNIEKIKPKLLSEIKKVEWFPSWGEIKMFNMIKDRKDWVISRQRNWGTPIPIFYTENNEPILDTKVIEHVADLFEKHGKSIWLEWQPAQLLPPNYKNEKSPNNIFYKETDIIDVWFDSGTTYSVYKKLFNNSFTADVYLEGADQYRGWFNSSLITSVAASNKTPYKKIITHGFVLDGSGQKMSKSLNNVIDPLKIIQQKGADILRLWVAHINYNIDVRLDKNILQQIEEKYKKIRNTFRFMLGNLNNFHPSSQNYIPFDERNLFDQLFLLEFNNILLQIIQSYENYNLEKIMSLLYPFIVNKMSAFYLDFSKDILYIEKEDNKEKNIIKSNIYDILILCLKILTPIIPHTTSEIYQYLSGEKKEDIYLESLPTQKEIQNWIVDFNQKQKDLVQLKEDYNLFFILREKILKKLEDNRQNKIINKSLQAKLILKLPYKYLQMLNSLKIKEKFHQLLMVSQLEIINSEDLNIEIIKMPGNPCPRCWNVIENKNLDDLCKRCLNFFKK
ncbi:isoleucyl-tRNA synthetase [Candidatus Phytoplasma luffae]|uniref:Isoleucine--tRNA ligase n=1 Tax=Loofah witches'-broom phytoplasma TaxID=35773 RepID=A0A975FJM5_LOWBP|nr:isoleucine--tRNA ligase [Candidatus Phytoplasma luffae]QTX02890.1 isoleucyl-tRNA synthetase [Candidatus Phytoplasma luffae]QTX03011.1 isoleucyl-tRNA synthetase [Candidatus Phytoplasma luffae]